MVDITDSVMRRAMEHRPEHSMHVERVTNSTNDYATAYLSSDTSTATYQFRPNHDGQTLEALLSKLDTTDSVYFTEERYFGLLDLFLHGHHYRRVQLVDKFCVLDQDLPLLDLWYFQGRDQAGNLMWMTGGGIHLNKPSGLQNIVVNPRNPIPQDENDAWQPGLGFLILCSVAGLAIAIFTMYLITGRFSLFALIFTLITTPLAVFLTLLLRHPNHRHRIPPSNS